MAEIGTIIDFFLPFGLGFIVGGFSGLFIAGLMNVASMDSRDRERREELDTEKKTTEETEDKG